MDRIFRTLADPSRRAIFECLTRGESAVKDLTARFEISQPAVSQHLAALRGAGLVSERREGRLVYYRIEPEGLRPLIDPVMSAGVLRGSPWPRPGAPRHGLPFPAGHVRDVVMSKRQPAPVMPLAAAEVLCQVAERPFPDHRYWPPHLGTCPS